MAWDQGTAWTLAVAEAVERYSSAALDATAVRWATAQELGEAALDLTTVPACSAVELAHPRCPLSAASPRLPIRWVRGVSLRDLRQVWLPAVMVHIRIPPRSLGERFWLPVSTGCAAHPDLAQALVNAICEVIERDAIALLWLRRLTVPAVELDTRLPPLPRHAGRIRVFDATTDVGIPVLFAVDRAPGASEVCTLVCGSSALDPRRAAEKLLAEAVLYRRAMERPVGIPADPDEFTQPVHGARYMSHPARAPCFSFLLETPARKCLSDLEHLATGSPGGDLAVLLDRLGALGMNAYAADLTTDEARRAGLHVVRVIVPELQPLTFRLRARYLGHRRLSDAPARMGYPARPEEEMNPWPQPFG